MKLLCSCRSWVWMTTLLVLSAGTPALWAAEVEMGISRESVIEALGEPEGAVQAGNLEFLQFERGTVELEDGKVSSSTVVSVAEHQRRLEAREKQAQEARRRAEKRRADLLRQGRAEKEAVLANGTVAAKPLEDQVKFWQTFSKTYPDVDVGAELSEAKTSLAAETRRRELELAEAEANRPTPPVLSSRRQRKVNRGRHSTGLFDPPE